PRAARTAARPGSRSRSPGTRPGRPWRCGFATAAARPAPTGCGRRRPAATRDQSQPAPAGWPCTPPRACPSLGKPEPVDEDVPLRVPRVTMDVARQEINLLGVV